MTREINERLGEANANGEGVGALKGKKGGFFFEL